MPENWESRQKHATFFQGMIAPVQQGAISAMTTSAIIVSIGGATAKFSGVAQSQDWLILFATVIAWILSAGLLVGSFSRSAVRIERRYLQEHAALFPGALPYRLETFLLDFADRSSFLTGKRTEVEAQPNDGPDAER